MSPRWLIPFAVAVVLARASDARACLTDVECTTAAAPICDAITHACRACQATDGGLVNECAVKNPTKPICALVGALAGQCVGCLSSKDCSGTPTTSTCNLTTGVCAPCQSDYSASNPLPLSCVDPQKPACQKAGGPLDGQCTQCSATNDTVCIANPQTPVCNATAGQCGCSKDSDCGAKTGLLCDPTQGAAGRCVAGCRGTSTGDNCPAGLVCSKEDGGAGVCGPAPCTKDSDCGGPTSGLVCGPSSTCEPGCRGSGGNGCPSGQVCSSTGPAIGQCSGGDGGAGDGGGSGDGGGASDGGGTGDGGGGGSGGGSSGGSGDGGLAPPGYVEGGGCACNEAGGSAGASLGLIAGVFFAVTAWARRRAVRAGREG